MVMVIPIVIATFATITENLVKGLEALKIGGRADTIQT